MKIDDPKNFDLFLSPADRMADIILKIEVAAAILEEPDESLIWALHQAIILSDAEEDALYRLEIERRESELAALYSETTADQTEGYQATLRRQMDHQTPKSDK